MRRVLQIIACVVAGFAGIAWPVSQFRGVYYAGGFFFFGITDGCLILPWPPITTPTWGDWGWWTAEPWGTAYDYYFPWLSPRSPGFVSPSISISMLPIFLVAYVPLALGWLMRRSPTTREAIKWVGNATWVVLWFGVVIDHRGVLGDLGRWALLCVGFPSVLLVFRDRCRGPQRPRYPLGHCQVCGYNLTGNVSGICSECGTKIQLDWLLPAQRQERTPRDSTTSD